MTEIERDIVSTALNTHHPDYCPLFTILERDVLRHLDAHNDDYQLHDYERHILYYVCKALTRMQSSNPEDQKVFDRMEQYAQSYGYIQSDKLVSK